MGEDPEYKGPNEDCVEECMSEILIISGARNSSLTRSQLVFHLQHCATTCAAPKLFRALK